MKKIANEFEGQPKFNPDFDIRKSVKNDDDAVGFVAQVIMEFPESLPDFLGMPKGELFTKISKNLREILKNAPPEVLQDLEIREKEKEKQKEKSFDELIGRLKKLISMFGGNPLFLKSFVPPILGFKGQGELLKRLYDYVPMVVKGISTEMEKELTEDNKWEKQQAMDRILDQYNAGKINEQQMQNMMREFAGYKPILVKTASGVEIQWEKTPLKVIKTASGKYKISKETWENIGKSAGWLKKL